ncbi:hypothetical protein IWW37_001013 [Coemansia sp. RSA 2050]|nr:hypothetical protein IWW37_001013 [Coemansia sp. RSA 2050]KAJ2736237.1 hypothetical protein IW152_001006 [Coemansia sp. BCRC 34962]
MAVGRPCTDLAWTSFRSWCKEQGLPKTQLTLAYFPATFRGMMATRDIGPGEDVVRVPERLLITASKVKRAMLARAAIAGKAGKAVQSDRWDLSEHQSLAYWVYVEAELQERSEWHSYICSLPRDFASTPLFVLSGKSPSSTIDTDSSGCVQWVIAHLPHPLRQRVSEQQTRLFGDWSLTCSFSAAFGTQPVSNWRLYVWSWLVVSTRCIHLGRRPGSDRHIQTTGASCLRGAHSIGSRDNITLAPMLDLLNHSEHASVSTFFDADGGEFVIKTNVPFKAGREVFISYGPHDNLFLLAEYGFVLERNPFQHLELDHAADLWVAAAKARMQGLKRVAAPACPASIDTLVGMLKQRGLWGDFALLPDDTEPPYRLQSALRLLLAVEQQGTPVKRAIAQWERWLRGEPEGAESRALDFATSSWIRAACQGLLSASARMLDDTGDVGHEALRGLGDGGPSAFLVHCIHTVWVEINTTAARHCS